MTANTERVALLDEEESEEFIKYAETESTLQEKQELKDDLDFYLKYCKKNKR